MTKKEFEIYQLWYEEERLLAAFSRRLVEIATVSNSGITPASVLNIMHIPALAVDWHGVVVAMTDAAAIVLDNDIKIKNGRLFVYDPLARALLDEAILELSKPRQIPLAVKPFVIRRRNKLPVLMRIWPFAVPSCRAFNRMASPMHAVLSVFPILDAFGQARDYM